MDSLKKRFCEKPFLNAEFHLEGNVYVCCPSWLPKKIGNSETQSMAEIWNSKEAHEIRASIHDGSFQYCDHNLCPYIQNRSLPMRDQLQGDLKKIAEDKTTSLESRPLEIMFTYDRSCNLSCPSCRNGKISFSPGSTEFQSAELITEKIFNEFIKDLGDHHLTLNITGSGDPFAAHSFRQFLENLDGKNYPNLKIDFQTNGLLLTPLMWDRMKKIHANISRLFVSIDAATEETYKVVRRGGQWKIIQENIEFLAQLRKMKKINLLQVNFVVQKENYKEMADFARMFLKKGCDSIAYSLVTNWGTWDEQQFRNQQIWNPEHPEHAEFLRVLEDNIFSHYRIFLGNLYRFRMLAHENKKKQMSLFVRTLYNIRKDILLFSYFIQKRKFFLPKKITNALSLMGKFYRDFITRQTK